MCSPIVDICYYKNITQFFVLLIIPLFYRDIKKQYSYFVHSSRTLYIAKAPAIPTLRDSIGP